LGLGSSTREEIDEVFDVLMYGLDRLCGLTCDVLTTPGRLVFRQRLERVARRMPVPTPGLTAFITPRSCGTTTTQGTDCEIGAVSSASVSEMRSARPTARAVDALAELERAENFPVALRVLPARLRSDLHAVYAVARTIDDLGDCAAGDRTAALRDFRTDLHRIWAGSVPRRPVLRALVPAVQTCGLSSEPFDRLIEAGLTDQRVSRYQTFDELLGYCRLSAEPVGRLVLDVFGQNSPAATEFSDRVSVGLGLLDIWQDIGEDRRAGRVYLPAEDLAEFGVGETDLDAPRAGPALKALMAFETRRAASLLESGVPLLNRVRGWARIAIAGYIAGGRATVAALRRNDFDVLGTAPRARRRDTARAASALLLRAQCGKEIGP